MPKTRVTVILPGVAAVLKHKINDTILPTYLKKIIRYSDFKADETALQRVLTNQFSSNEITGTDLPLAGFFGENLLFADPCYLHADQERLLLFSDNLDITSDERQALFAEIQPLLSDFNAKLIEPESSEHWLLKLDERADLSFTALEDVSKKGIEDALPQGSDRKQWLQLWNEIQMQLHTSEVNQQRKMQGKYPINSVWFWGAGEFIYDENRWDSVSGTGSLLARLAEQSMTTLTHSFDWSLKGKQLWLLDEIDTEADWMMQLEKIDEQIFKSIWQACSYAKISRVSLLIPEYGVFNLTPLKCWQFWQ